MASIITTFLRLSVLLFSLLLLTKARAKLNLDRSDHNAFLTIQRGLGINNQHHCFHRNPCNNTGVICERRVTDLSSALKITHIIFESKKLSGSISPVIGQLTELKELTVSNNQLFDQLPPQIVNCRKLEVLILKNNHFFGRIPSQLSKLVRLRVLDLSSNRFSGDLSFLNYFPNLEILSLGDNLFTGKIPVSLKSFRNLRFFNASGNHHIQGQVPVLHGIEYISSETTRRSIVPRRYRLAESSTSTTANHSSAAAPKASRASGPAPAHSPASSAVHKSKKHKKKKKPGAYALGFLAGAVAGAVSGFIFSVLVRLIIICVNGPGKGSGPVLFSPLIKKKEELAFLENDDGLANMEFLGRGGCGEVFKAQLPGENGKFIAIKKIAQPSKDAKELTEEDTKLMNKKMRQIKSEIQTVGRIRHRNLLPLLAHVPRPDCHYLVYEFMKNGSLQDLLSEVSEGRAHLDWPARHRIAIGIATGLEHLHVNTSPLIIHRDLKPANVLLDDDMEARIADFGLAKAMPDAHTHITTSNVAGTVGYIAPEYHQTLKFTDKCDVYSFGVLLGVLVMGKLPSDEFFQHTPEMCLVKWMRNVMTSEEPKSAIDLKLLGSGNEEQMLQALKIACFCTLDDPKQRPNSKDIRVMLDQIKQSTNPSSSGI